jgi:hypothetical protein
VLLVDHVTLCTLHSIDELSDALVERDPATLLALAKDPHPQQAVVELRNVVSAHVRPAPPDKCQARVSSASHRSGSNSANTGRP